MKKERSRHNQVEIAVVNQNGRDTEPLGSLAFAFSNERSAMRDYKFVELSKIDRSFEKYSASLKAPRIAEVVNAFVSNMNRAYCLAVFPIELPSITVHAMTMLAGLVTVRFLQNKQDVNFNIMTDLRSILEDHGSSIDAMARALWDDPVYADQLRQMIADSIIPRLANDIKVFEIAIDAFLAAVIVNSWTAFETLAGDLWVSAINAHPHGLSRLAGKEKRISFQAGVQKEPSESGGRRDEDDKKIPLNRIHDVTLGTFDLSSKMGDLLKGRVRFTSLWEIRRAYSLAFSDKIDKKVTEAVDAALADNALDSLSLVRNVIVHKSGIADEEYDNERKRLPAVPQVDKGQPISSDGDIVRCLVEPAARCSLSLLETIDAWLDDEKNRKQL